MWSNLNAVRHVITRDAKLESGSTPVASKFMPEGKRRRRNQRVERLRGANPDIQNRGNAASCASESPWCLTAS